MFQKTATTWKKQIITTNATVLSTTKSDTNESSDDNLDTIDKSILIDFISTGDFEKVEKIIKTQITSDKKAYNKKVLNYITNINSSLDAYYKAQAKVLSNLQSLNTTLLSLKWKDYFIKWFNKIDFQLSDINNEKITIILDKLKKHLSNNEYEELMSDIFSAINHSENQNKSFSNNNTDELNSDKKSISNINTVNINVDKTEKDQTQDNISCNNPHTTKTFDIEKNFMNDDLNQKDIESLNRVTDNEILPSENGINLEIDAKSTKDNIDKFQNNFSDINDTTTTTTNSSIPINKSEIIDTPDIEDTEVTNWKEKELFNTFESINDFDFEDEENEEGDNWDNTTNDKVNDSNNEVLDAFKLNIL